MSGMTETIEVLRREDASAAVELIIEGLTERWGGYDARLNPDLSDFWTHYRESTVVVAKINQAIVGTGILEPTETGAARIVRMSVAQSMRRQGIGTRILEKLLSAAVEQGYVMITLETTVSWRSVIEFYRSHGFTPTFQSDGNQYFVREVRRTEV